MSSGPDAAALDELIAGITAFLAPGGDRSLAAANAIEVALDELLGDEPVFEGYVTDLACYTPHGGPYLLNEVQLCARLASLLARLAAHAHSRSSTSQ